MSKWAITVASHPFGWWGYNKLRPQAPRTHPYIVIPRSPILMVAITATRRLHVPDLIWTSSCSVGENRNTYKQKRSDLAGRPIFIFPLEDILAPKHTYLIRRLPMRNCACTFSLRVPTFRTRARVVDEIVCIYMCRRTNIGIVSGKRCTCIKCKLP